MNNLDTEKIINEVRQVSNLITHAAELSQADSLLGYYSNSDDFVAFGGDGIMRKYQEFKDLCIKFYGSVTRQEFTTLQENYYVVYSNLVILSWMGNINAFFKNGDTMKLKNYGVTNIFKKDDGAWKVIHSHESSLPPEIQKAK